MAGTRKFFAAVLLCLCLSAAHAQAIERFYISISQTEFELCSTLLRSREGIFCAGRFRPASISGARHHRRKQSDVG